MRCKTCGGGGCPSCYAAMLDERDYLAAKLTAVEKERDEARAKVATVKAKLEKAEALRDAVAAHLASYGKVKRLSEALAAWEAARG